MYTNAQCRIVSQGFEFELARVSLALDHFERDGFSIVKSLLPINDWVFGFSAEDHNSNARQILLGVDAFAFASSWRPTVRCPWESGYNSIALPLVGQFNLIVPSAHGGFQQPQQASALKVYQSTAISCSMRGHSQVAVPQNTIVFDPRKALSFVATIRFIIPVLLTRVHSNFFLFKNRSEVY